MFLIDFGDVEYIEDLKECKSLNMAGARNLCQSIRHSCEHPDDSILRLPDQSDTRFYPKL